MTRGSANQSPTAFVASALRRALILPLALSTITGALVLGLTEHVRTVVECEVADREESDAIESINRRVVEDESDAKRDDRIASELRDGLAAMKRAYQRRTERAGELAALIEMAGVWVRDREKGGELPPPQAAAARARLAALHAKLDGLHAKLETSRGADQIAVRKAFTEMLALVAILSMALGVLIAVYVRRDLARVSRAFKGALDTATETTTLQDEFIATVSHELRTPIHAIIGWTTLMRRRQDDKATMLRAMETLDRNARKLSRIVDQVVDMSNLVAGKLALSPDVIDVSSTLRSVVVPAKTAAAAKGIRLSLTLDGEVGPLWGDPRRVRQIVTNLLDNAIKFTPRGGRIVVGAARAGEEVELRVSDSGAGLPRDFLPHAFEQFRHGETSSTRSQGGIGLGLAIVQRLVALHGGAVRVDSPGDAGGATFVVTLPHAPARA